MNAHQGIIHIKRIKALVGSGVAHRIFLDNVEIGKLNNGKNNSFFISPGPHTIHTTAPFAKSPEILFDIEPGERIEFDCGVELAKGMYLRQSTKKVTPANNNQSSAGDIKETTHYNDMDIYSEDEFPIDNRFGSEALTVEHEVSKTASNELVMDSKADKSGSFGADVSFFKAQIAASISKQIGHTIGESITRKQRFTFTVKPGEISIYKIIWKRKVRSGEYLISVNNKIIPIAYRVEYDLVCEVRSVGPSS